MGCGVFPDGINKTLEKNVNQKHITIVLPGSSRKYQLISTKSLMFLAYHLNKPYVILPGLSNRALEVSSLSYDILKAEVLAYDAGKPLEKTFTAVIKGSGFERWAPREI